MTTGMKGVRGFVARPEVDRFWEKVDRSGYCWTWTGSKLKRRGVGTFKNTATRKIEYAPRVCWRLTFGAVPDGFYVCHRCDNPACVRPDHLFLGTQTDNMRDMAAKGRHVSPRRSMTHCCRGHKFDEQNTKWFDGGKHRICRKCHALREWHRRRGLPFPKVGQRFKVGGDPQSEEALELSG